MIRAIKAQHSVRGCSKYSDHNSPAQLLPNPEDICTVLVSRDTLTSVSDPNYT